jgi:lysophospholipase L1-like esterase
MLPGAHSRWIGRATLWMVLFTFPVILGGCVFFIDHLVPAHGNVGDRMALRNPRGTEPLPSGLEILFSDIQTQSVLRESPDEIVVEVPPGVVGKVPVSVWLGFYLVSNTKPFLVDAEPIAYRILAFGDSLVGPWVYHPQMLDTLLNQDVGPSVVINEGKAGEILSEGVQRLGDVLSIHSGVEYMYVLEGANDVADRNNTPIGQMLASLDQMMDLAGFYGITPVIVTVPPRTRNALSEDQTTPTTEDWNDALRMYALSNGIELVDLYQAFVTHPGWESFLEDFGLHLTEEGQEFVAQVVYSVIAPLLE